MLKNIGSPRLSTVQAFFQTQNDRELLGCYSWNQALASSLLPLLGDLEVTLRNALHKALSQHYGGTDSYSWMLQRPNPAQAMNPKAPLLPSIHKMNQRSQEEVNNAVSNIGRKKRGHTVTPDDVVGALNFGFWEILIKNLDFSKHPKGLQQAVLSSVFPHAPAPYAGNQGTAAFKDEIVDRLSRIRDVRNRIGHHDALWKHPEFQAPGAVGFIPRRPRHTIKSFAVFAERLLELVGWINPEIRAHVLASDHWATFDVLLSRRAIALFRYKGGQAGLYKELLSEQEFSSLRHDLPARVLMNYPHSTITVLRSYHY